MTRLRIEETPPKVEIPVVVEEMDWKAMATRTAERLSHAEAQCGDLRKAADDARARFGKYKTRLDGANARVNELQVEVVRLSKLVSELRMQLADQAALAQKVHAYRESLLTGPLWELFVDLSVSSDLKAGGTT